MTIKESKDIDLLAQLYSELMEDEQADYSLTKAQSKERIAKAFNRGQISYVFCENEVTVGYALVIPNRKPVYLHHFYICRDHRRKGFGKRAFNMLMQTLGTDTIDLDVFVWNERGRAFWNSLGFTPRATIMRYKAK